MPTRILFNTWANRENLNSQSLTAREIAIRLDPSRFLSQIFIGANEQADPRCVNQPHIQLIRIPPRLGSLVIAYELIWGKYDILFYPSINERASQLFWALRSLGRKKRIIESIECSFDQIHSVSKPALERTLYNMRHADLRVSITPAIVRAFRQTYGFPSRVIPLGVDLSLFKMVDRSSHVLPVQVIYVATIQPRKQPHLILDLARVLRDEPVEFHLIGPVIGDPSYQGKLMTDAVQDGLDNVFFHGGMRQEEIIEWMSKSDIFILPSRLEGFGKVTIEAGATGLPAIIFSDYESTAVLDGVTGFQVKTFDEMLSKLKLLIVDRDLRLKMGSAAVQHSKQFDWDLIVKQWEQVFVDLANAHS
jgi:glycosyltransferase involved in cell wall biosynthesis